MELIFAQGWLGMAVRLLLVYSSFILVTALSVWLGDVAGFRAMGALGKEESLQVCAQLTAEFAVTGGLIIFAIKWLTIPQSAILTTLLIAGASYVANVFIVLLATFWADPAGLLLGRRAAPTFRILSEWNWLQLVLLSLPITSISLGLLSAWLLKSEAALNSRKHLTN